MKNIGRAWSVVIWLILFFSVLGIVKVLFPSLPGMAIDHYRDLMIK